MNELKKEYLNYLEMQTGKSDNSIVSFFKKAGDFEVYYKKEVEKFNQEDIKELLKFFAKTSPNSLAVYFSRLKKYYGYLYEFKGITSLVNYIDMKYSDYKDFVSADVYTSRIIAKEELYASLGKIVNPCDRLLVLLIFLGIKGERNIDLLNLKKSDIDLNSRHILVNGKHYSFDATIETEIRNTNHTNVYYMNNGRGDTLAAQRKNRVNLLEDSEYVFRPIELKLNLKRDKSTLKKLTPQSIQKRVLAILHDILDKPNMTLQTLYVSGVIQKLVDYSNGEEMTNKEVREWIDLQNISVTKQEVYKLYTERMKRVASNDDSVYIANNQIEFTNLTH